MVDQSVAILELETALVDYFGNSFHGKSVFDYLNNGLSSLSTLGQDVSDWIKFYLRNGHCAPHEFCLSVLRFFEWIYQFRFRESLILPLAILPTFCWKRILKREKFQISKPAITVPLVVEFLENSGNVGMFGFLFQSWYLFLLTLLEHGYHLCIVKT